MSTETFLSATPVLASLDIRRSVEFYARYLGFEARHVEQGVYGVMTRDDVGLHFWACSDRHIAENTSCRFRVSEVEALYQRCLQANIVHPNAKLESKPWGATEFAIIDPDGNLVWFSRLDDQ